MLKDRLRAARKAAGKTQNEVAVAIGVTESTYCGYETGKRSPDALKIAKIAAVLGVSGDQLLEIQPPEAEGGVDELVAIFESVSEKGRAMILAYARMIAGMDEYRD